MPSANGQGAHPLARTALCIVLACALAGLTVFATGCSPAITNSSANSDADHQNEAPADALVRPIERVTDDDPLLAFAANTSMAVLNGPDADGSNGDPEAFMEKNLCFSPVSLYLACTLLGTGTQGAAQDQLLGLLGVSDADALRTESERIRQQLQDVYGDAVIKVADSIWAGEGFAFTDEFLHDVEALGGAAFAVRFGTEEADRQIAGWITEQTNGLLRPEISTELGQAALLINTIYFKDAWAEPFETANDVTEAFKAPGFDVQANYLRQTITDSQYAEGEGFTAASLGFSGGSTMTFVRPNNDVMLYQLIESAKEVQDLLKLEMEFRSVDWWIPRFQTDSSLRHLAETLRSLGVTNVFSPVEPDAFAPMLATDGGLDFRVSDVQQDTHLALDENGVEAAAFTSIGIEKMSLAPEMEPVEFKLDRSFLYYVTSPDGIVLFVGVVYNPNL